MGEAYPIKPVRVTSVASKHRRISGLIPDPESASILEKLRRQEPACMEGQPPILWDHAEGFYVFDARGNQWIDFSSGVLITNAGHSRQEMVDAICRQAKQGLLTSYCFANMARAKLVDMLQAQAPRPDDKVMLLSTGAEATELCIKLCRKRGQSLGKRDPVMVTFDNAFHGRTLGAQLAGGIESLKSWIGYSDGHFVNVPFPDGVRCRPDEMDFSAFEKALRYHGVDEESVCGVMTETYQGGNSSFAPPAYMQALRQWCTRHQAALVMDEVQAGFGRTGKFWGFEHYGIVPDLIACGKGISGSLPLSAVIGKAELLDQFAPGSMTSTHSGNPVCCAAAAAHLELILRDQLVHRAAQVGMVMQDCAERIQRRFSHVILAHHGKGLVASLHCVQAGTSEPDPKLAWEVVGQAVQSGVMLFGPVGFGGASVKLAPPLVITADAVNEAMMVIEDAFAAVLQRRHSIAPQPTA